MAEGKELYTLIRRLGLLSSGSVIVSTTFSLWTAAVLLLTYMGPTMIALAIAACLVITGVCLLVTSVSVGIQFVLQEREIQSLETKLRQEIADSKAEAIEELRNDPLVRKIHEAYAAEALQREEKEEEIVVEEPAPST